MSSAVVVFRCLWHTVVPVGLTSRYSVMLYGDPFEPAALTAIVGVVAMVLVTLWLMRRKRPEAFWFLWFAITLAPVLNIIPFLSMMQDRYMYLALLGPLGLVGSLLDSAREHPTRRLLAVGAAGLCLVLAFATARQVRHWASPAALWIRDAMVRPLWAYERILYPEDYPLKLTRLTDAVAEDPFDPTLRTNLGGLYFSAQRDDDALIQLEAAQRLAPAEPYNLINLGRTYARLDRPEDAERVLRQATELMPHDRMPCYHLLRLYIEESDAKNAHVTLDRCSAIDENLPTERRQVQALEAAGR